jgi:hypothetical protein
MRMSPGWQSAVLASIAVMFLSLYPQLHLWYALGEQWNGTYALFDTDEVAYSAYLNALIDGRPRRNDPYTGRDDLPGQPQPESLFSIQFAPPYALALASRALGLSASTVFILLAALAALVSSLMIFRLIRLVTNDERLAATAVLVVLCLGTLATGHGAVRELRGIQAAYHYLPFLRRYIPALIFPFYFALCALVWQMLTTEDKRRAVRHALLAGATFALLVYSYFYLWTAAVAWLVCLALLWLLIRPAGYSRALKLFGVVGALMIAALLPFLFLISNRAETMEAVQALTFSHAPDLWRVPEMISAAVLLALAFSAHRGRVRWRDTAIIFTASFALVPFVVFNQQVITGRSLQPIHYEQFIANYVSLVAVVLAAALLWRAWGARGERKIPKRVLASVALAAFAWGVAETHVAIRIFTPFDLIRNDSMPVASKLDELARESAGESGHAATAPPVVLFTDVLPADDLPTVAPQAVLWARHMHVFSGVTLAENKERFYQYLYYTGVTEQILTHALAERDFYYILPLFGWERANSNLTVNWKPITQEEILDELREYAAYVNSFNHERAAHPTISYVVTSQRLHTDLSNLDRWYERDEGEHIGDYTLYRVKLRP